MPKTTLDWYQLFISAYPKPVINSNALTTVRTWVLAANDFIAAHVQPYPSADRSSTTSLGMMSIEISLALRTYVYEQVLIELFGTLNLGDEAALFAVGGFGRGEMLPYSDVDLLVVYQGCDPPPPLSPLHRFMALVWDIGLTPAISLRHISHYDCTQDITIATSFIESRYLTGLSTLQDIPKTWVRTVWVIDDFFAAKIQETKERHARFGYHEHSLEPNIKEAVGGLRDIHLLRWLGGFTLTLAADDNLDSLIDKGFLMADECHALMQAQRFFWTIRHHLHTIANKGDDKLDFGAQKILAERMGYGTAGDYDNHAPEALMKDYYHHAMTCAGLSVLLSRLFFNTHISPEHTQQPINDRFVITTRQNDISLAVCDESVFKRHSTAIFELFLLMAQHHIKQIEAQTLRQLCLAARTIDDNYRQDPEHKKLFIANLSHPNYLYHRLYLMKYTGILGAYLPDFEQIMGLMQYDLFHRYTVDAHTLRLIRLLHRFDDERYGEFSIARQIYRELDDKLPLVIAALFHDIAKGRGGDHSELGADLVDKFCLQHNIIENDRKLIVWLVRHHLVMSTTAQKKDIFDPIVINEFADFALDVRHLDHLYLLTVADMNATNAQLWNNWRATLLRKLYLSCHHVLSDNKKVSPQTIIDNKKIAAYAHLDKLGTDRQAVEKLWQNITPEYFLKESSDDIAWHTQAILHHQNQQHTQTQQSLPLISIRAHYDKHLHAHQLLIYTPNQDNLFAKTVAILDKFGYSVYGANILTTHDNYALDSYILVNDMMASTTVLRDDTCQPLADYPLPDGEKQALIGALKNALTQNTCNNDEPSPKLIMGRMPHKHFAIATEISFEAIPNSHQYYLHLTTKDRTSLLAKIGTIFSRLNIDVHAAKITTLGERAEDIFCISDKDANTLSFERQKQLEAALQQALED